ncbi:MAG: 4Fe-4S dicluster domain-containing protein [Syntrophaceae bacterium]|nr:4Fe-4S dicluster domain-containing protein [Syntrophaceae bacterium]
MKRKIIKIDEEKCNGCGLCITHCDEKALEIHDGKARLIDEGMCDGLGLCLDECPEGALSVEEREAEPFSGGKLWEDLVQKETLIMEDYLRKMSESGDTEFHKEYGNFLKLMKDDPNGPVYPDLQAPSFGKMVPGAANFPQEDKKQSELTHWPIQLHLVDPMSDIFSGKDVVLAADCVAYMLADFHKMFLKDKKLVIACARLDRDVELYTEELRLMVDVARINTLTAVIMQVPCCSGLLRIAKEALQKAARKVPLKAIVVSTGGEVLSEEWV